MTALTEIQTLVREGEAEKLQAAIRRLLADGCQVGTIIDEGLLPAMVAIGEDFKTRDIFIPEVMIAARAMNAGLALLRPLSTGDSFNKGTAVIGTVKGDCHDIGKNIVKTMLEGKGLNVVDLGVDVSAEQFLAAAGENSADLICCAALLTTTMGEMGRVVQLARQESQNYTVMIGGAVVSQTYCDAIGADCYAPDAASAAVAAAAICGAKTH